MLRKQLKGLSRKKSSWPVDTDVGYLAIHVVQQLGVDELRGRQNIAGYR